MAYVYILQNQQGHFYVGSTTDMRRRLKQHESGNTPTTVRLGGHFKVVLSQEYDTLREARTIEKRLKKLKRHDYLEKMVRDGAIHMQP